MSAHVCLSWSTSMSAAEAIAFRSSTKFKTRDSQDSVERQIGLSARIHTRGFEHRCHVVASGKIDGGAVYRRRVQENWHTTRNASLQCQEEVFGDLRPICKERTDLVSGMTRAKDSIAGEGAALNKTQRGSLRLMDPAF